MNIPAADLTKLNDEELVALAQKKEPGAFEELMRRNSSSSYRLALSILKDTQDAEDEVQNSYFTAWKAIERFRGDSKFTTWMSRIVTNQCLMRLRKLRRARVVSMDDDTDERDGALPMQLADPTDSPEVAWGNTELGVAVRREIAKLPPILRDVLVLRDVKSLPTADVARELGITDAAAKSRVLRARAELRQRLGATLSLGPATLGLAR